MSIKDSTGNARSFSLVSQNGFTRSFSGADTTSTTEIVDKQTRTTKPLATNSWLRSTIVRYLDADGNQRYVKVNTTIEFPNELQEATTHMRDALLINHRGLVGSDDLSGTPSVAETTLDSIARGIPPTP